MYLRMYQLAQDVLYECKGRQSARIYVLRAGLRDRGISYFQVIRTGYARGIRCGRQTPFLAPSMPVVYQGCRQIEAVNKWDRSSTAQKGVPVQAGSS